jgi:hypothetical protein
MASIRPGWLCLTCIASGECEKSGVLDANAVAEDFRDLAAVGRAEIGVVEGAGDGDFSSLVLKLGEEVASFQGSVFRAVDEVNGRAALFVEFGDSFLELGGGVFELVRDRALVGLDEGGGRGELLVFSVQFSEKRRKRARGNVSSGICQAVPREWS